MENQQTDSFDVTALGELLIDFTENGVSSQGNPLFEANPGGAPCNVLAMLAKLGRRTAFIGKVGHDCFGDQLRTAIEEIAIPISIPHLPLSILFPTVTGTSPSTETPAPI